MNRVQRTTADPSSEDSPRCEDCGTERTDAEAGWLRVTYPTLNRHEARADVLLYYCPVHAVHFDVRYPWVVPAFE